MHISTRNWASQFNDSGERGGDSNHLAANPSRIDPEVNRILATEVVKSDDGWTVNHGRRKEGEREGERERERQELERGPKNNEKSSYPGSGLPRKQLI